MMENLAYYSDALKMGQHIPPVISFTSVGPKAKLWLAYATPKDDGFRDHVGQANSFLKVCIITSL
jgi:hypothetical protein